MEKYKQFVTPLVILGIVTLILTLITGYLGERALALILSSVSGVSFGIAAMFTLWQIKWLWRFIEESRPRTIKEKYTQTVTIVILLVLDLLFLIYLLYPWLFDCRIILCQIIFK